MKRLITQVIILGLVLSACSTPPAAAVMPPAAPSTPVSAPKAPPLPDPAWFRAEPSLTVRTEKRARVYTGRGPWYLLVADFPAGTEMAYMGSREGWLQVRTPTGETGWLAAADAAVSDSRNQAIQYQVRPGHWQMTVESGPQIEVSRAATGVIVVTVWDPGGAVAVQELQGASLLLTTAAKAGGSRSAMDIGDSGLERISVSERGILLEVAGEPIHRVTQAEGSRITVEFRPSLERLERTATGWAIQTRGDLHPVLRQEKRELVLDLPGALAGGLRLRLPVPSAPYGLYRTGPGQLELRVLPSGLKGKTVLLDPGHGGEETGAEGVAGNLEKDVNLAVALLLRPMLEEAGARVIMTRTADSRVLAPAVAEALKTLSERTQADLAARSAQANQARVDLVVSIHANWGDSGDVGTETFWTVANLNAAESRHLAQLMQQELLAGLGLVDRGVKQRPFNVIRFSDAPAVLVELGFMSDAAEEQLLASREGQQSSAEALLRAIRRYFGE